MKKFKVYGISSFKDGQIITEKKLRNTKGGWIRYDWDGTVESLNKTFRTWKVVRVKRRFEIVEIGDWWSILRVGDVCKKKELLTWFTELDGWDGSIEELNKKLVSVDAIKNSHIIFKEVYIEVEDK